MLIAFRLARDDFLNKPYVWSSLEKMSFKLTLEGSPYREDRGRQVDPGFGISSSH